MNNQGPFDNDNSQFVISYELLCLLHWLFENEQETLKKLIEKSFSNGLAEKIYNRKAFITDSQEELQQSIIDFFLLLESFLYDLFNEQEAKKLMERHLIPAIDRIDSSTCDNTTFALSIAKATAAYENDPKQNPKEVLCKELLKRWKPSKKIEIH